MNTIHRIAPMFLAFALAAAMVPAAEKKSVAGPKGGRLFENTPQKTEFFVSKDRKAEINFYDATMKPQAPGTQVVTIIAETKGGRQVLPMEKTAHGFVSKTALPEGEPYRVVVQLKESTAAKPQNFRLTLDLHECAECKYAEYACTCGH